MKVRLLFEDRDSRPIVLPRNQQAVREMFDAPQPPVVEDVINDLDLITLWNAMAREDAMLWLAARQLMLAGPLTPDQVRYRQEALRDALDHSDVVRQLFDVATSAVEAERNVYRGVFADRGERLLSWALQVLKVLRGNLQDLRRIADGPGRQFRSAAFRTLFDEIRDQLDDAYLAEVDAQLADLRFSEGIVLSARLGTGNRGIGYVLRRPEARNRRGLFTKNILRKPTFAFTIPERDESSFRALADLRDRGLQTVADSVGAAADQVIGYFTALRSELACYVGALNLTERLGHLGLPLCLPTPMPAGDEHFEASRLYDPCLALRKNESIAGNDIDAVDVSLVVVTGANQGGKSTFVRSLGIAHLLLRAGLMVPAASFTAGVADRVFTHFRREEDSTMAGGKFDEELSRMDRIVDDLRPGALLLCNESFAATNEREGSQVAESVIDALREAHIRVVVVTHMYDLAHHYEQDPRPALFLRADPLPDGTRDHLLRVGGPLRTSHAADVYRSVFHEELQPAG